MKEDGNEENNTLSIEDIVNESMKPIMIPIAIMGNKCIPYIRPSDDETDTMKAEVEKEILVIKERDKLNCFTTDGKPIVGKVPTSAEELDKERSSKLSELSLWFGLNKANPNVTKESLRKLPADVKTQISLFLTKLSFGNLLTDEEIGGLKNLLTLSKAL